ncbi:17507_t:CDS:10, partial [Rhizophagus irregularis]
MQADPANQTKLQPIVFVTSSRASTSVIKREKLLFEQPTFYPYISMDSKKVSISKKEYDFFINEARPTPTEFFKKFNCTSKKTAVSIWYSALREVLKIRDDLKLVNIEQNYKDGKYKQAIDDYFKTSVLEKEKTYVDKTLTKKTSKAIRSRIDDLLPEETGSKKPRLMESQQNDDSSILMSADPKIKQEFPGSCSSTSGPSSKPHLEEDIESKYYDAGKRHKILYSWKDSIDNIDIRDASKKDWIFENHNLSNDFRNFQQKTIKQVKENSYLCFKKDFHKILCLSNIMLVEQKKPSYLTCDQAIWSTICRRQTSPVLSLVITTVISEYSSLLNCFASLDEIEDRWCANFAKVTELNNEDRANFCKYSINKNNEDTFVHSTLHDLINEMFRDPLLELVWANSESTASKRQRSNDKENTVKGNKPDFKILNNDRDEILFGEVKPKDSSSILVKKDFIKLGDFQVATLNEIIKKHGNKNGLISFGIWVTGARIRFYEMDLSYDGIYRMVLVSNVVIPTERAQFLNLMTVLEAFFNIKRRISEVITVIASNTPPNSPSRSTYGRVPTSSPKPVK